MIQLASVEWLYKGSEKIMIATKNISTIWLFSTTNTVLSNNTHVFALKVIDFDWKQNDKFDFWGLFPKISIEEKLSFAFSG